MIAVKVDHMGLLRVFYGFTKEDDGGDTFVTGSLFYEYKMSVDPTLD